MLPPVSTKVADKDPLTYIAFTHDSIITSGVKGQLPRGSVYIKIQANAIAPRTYPDMVSAIGFYHPAMRFALHCLIRLSLYIT